MIMQMEQMTSIRIQEYYLLIMPSLTLTQQASLVIQSMTAVKLEHFMKKEKLVNFTPKLKPLKMNILIKAK